VFFSVKKVCRCLHAATTTQSKAAKRILIYVKYALRAGITFQNHLIILVFFRMQVGQDVSMIDASLEALPYPLDQTQYHGVLENIQCHDPVLELNTKPYQMLQTNLG
jgi:hypothetical protein